jgi:hypothetical protein
MLASVELLLGTKAGPLIPHQPLVKGFGAGVLDDHFLVGIEAVAVADGIDDCFL